MGVVKHPSPGTTIGLEPPVDRNGSVVRAGFPVVLMGLGRVDTRAMKASSRFPVEGPRTGKAVPAPLLIRSQVPIGDQQVLRNHNRVPNISKEHWDTGQFDWLVVGVREDVRRVVGKETN